MSKTAIKTTKTLLNLSLGITFILSSCIAGAHLYKYITGEDTQLTVENKQFASAPIEAKVVPPQISIANHTPIFHCESGTTCYSSDKATINSISKTLDHLDPNTRYNYTLIVSGNSIESIAYKTQADLIEVCSDEKLCVIRNGVQKGTILKDLSRIGEGEKSVFFKYSPTIPKRQISV